MSSLIDERLLAMAVQLELGVSVGRPVIAETIRQALAELETLREQLVDAHIAAAWIEAELDSLWKAPSR